MTLTIRNPGETVLLWGNLWTVVAVGVGVLWLRDWAGKIEIIAYEQPDRTQQRDPHEAEAA